MATNHFDWMNRPEKAPMDKVRIHKGPKFMLIDYIG
jgi:hypothetical protein